MANKFCCYCGELVRYSSFTHHHPNCLTTEHLVPRSRGGNNTLHNKKACCKKCNSWRGNKPLGLWIRELQNELYRETPKASSYTLEAMIENAKYWLDYVITAGAKLYVNEDRYKAKKKIYDTDKRTN